MRASPLLLSLAAVALAGVASAEPPPPASRWVGAPVLPAGQVEIAVVHELLVARYLAFDDQLGDPWADGIDLAVALGPDLTVGVSHSSRALGTVDRGGGWCHEARFHWCPSAYAGGSIDARWRVHDGARVDLAALTRVGLVGIDPLQPVVRLGASARAAAGPRGRWWLVAEPEVQIGLDHRELGNRDVLIAPLWLGVGRTRAAGWLQTGLRGQLVGLGDKVEIPFVLGGAVRLGPVRLGAELGWPKLAGPQNNGGELHLALWLAATR